MFRAGALMIVAGALGAATAAAGDLHLGEGTRLTLQLNDHLSTKLNAEGDSFTAEVIAPVVQGDRVVIPKGSIVRGTVSRVVRPGRFRGKAGLNVIFDSIRIPGRGEVPISAALASVDPDGNSGIGSEGTVEGLGSKGRDAGQIAKPGAVGAGIGALIGGGSGAAVGGGVGAMVGLASVLTTRGKDIELRRGSALEIVLDRALVVAADLDASSRHR
jgi:hypothetical protein